MNPDFESEGFLVLPDFMSADDCDALQTRAAVLAAGFDPGPARTLFSTRDQDHARGRYFLESGGAIRFFFEEAAPDQPNKIGHALHDLDPVFERVSRQPKLAGLAEALGLAQPLLQSMYIFKNPGVGGEVGWHQDATFLHTTPSTVTGFWIALDDADRDNGCLLALAGAHRGPLRRRFRRVGEGTVMEDLDATPWPKVEPTPIEVRRGTLVVLHGLLPHASSANRSARPRHAYALHLIDGIASYDADNWLQRPNFPLRGFRVIPKAELHCHLEGSVPPALARELAARNGLALPPGLFGADGQYAWRDFLSFLDAYDRVCGVLRTPRDFGDILYSYLQRTAAEGAVYVEMFCSPERPKALNIRYRDWVAALSDAVDRARRDFGIEARIIAICIRHLGPDRALALAQQMVAEPHPYVVALGMGGDEGKFAPGDFAPAYRLAQENGYGCTVHAGEVRGPESVWAAIRELPVTRIGHGVRSIEDPALIDELARRGIALEVCPGSNLALGLYPDRHAHPLHRLIAAGVRVTLASDDPPFFHTSLGAEYDLADLDEKQLRQITRTAIEASFADQATRQRLLKGVEA